MEEPNIIIRRAKKCDTGDINRLLYEVHKVHSDARPDIFKAGGKKYTESELEAIICRRGVGKGFGICFLHIQAVHKRQFAYRY